MDASTATAQTRPTHMGADRAPPPDPGTPFVVGRWAVDPASGNLADGERIRHLEPKMVDVLVYFAQRPGLVVAKEAILDSVWPDTAVGTHAFWRCIAGLRKALDDDRRAPSYIETVPRRGYRLIAAVRFERASRTSGPREDRPAAPSSLQPGALSWSRLLILALVLAVMAGVAAAILTLAAGDARHSTPGADLDSEAYRSFLHGRRRFAQRSPPDLRAARQAFERAVLLEPGFAAAWAGLAKTHIMLPSYARMHPRDHDRFARAAAGEALRLDPRSAQAYAALGFLRVSRDWDFPGAETAYRRSLALDPNDATTHQWLAELLTFRGRFDEAMVEIEQAAQLDPRSPVIRAVWGRLLHAAGHYGDAQRRLTEALRLEPRFHWPYVDLATVSERMGRPAEAAAWLLAWLRVAGGGTEDIENLKLALREEGLPAFWRWLLEGTPSPSSRAIALAALGDPEGSLAALSDAAEGRGEHLLHASFLPAFDRLRHDPRFRQATGHTAPPRVAQGTPAYRLRDRIGNRLRPGVLDLLR